LGWIKHIESITTATSVSVDDAVATAVGASSSEVAAAEEEPGRTKPVGTEWLGLGKWWLEKTKCYTLLTLGFIFFAVGTFASLADIVRIYMAE